MRIAVDLVYFTGKKGGTETYARSLYTAIGRAYPDVELVALVNTELCQAPPDWFPGETVSLPVSGENRVAWALAENTLVPAAASWVRADVLHCPANFGPALSRVPVVLTVHDLLGFRFPDLISAGSARVVQSLTHTSVHGARTLLTDSESSAADLREFLSVPPGRVEVVPLAAAADPTTSAGTPTPPNRRPFLLSTGNRLPHKNFATLLRALAMIPPAERPLLVLTGSHGEDPLRPLVAELGLVDDVELLGWVGADQLEVLYRDAVAYLLPSRFEGFGLPVLEAMARGCPVVCSDIPVLREVGGGAALYVDTLAPEVLASTVRRLLADEALRAALAAAGVERAKRFSWNRVADATMAVLSRASHRKALWPGTAN